MPFRSQAQAGWAFATGQPFARRWARATGPYKKLPRRVRRKMKEANAAIVAAAIAQWNGERWATTKDAAPVAGAPLAGPGGLLGVPGLGRARKWGNRTKDKACTCGVNVATKEQIAPGITRIRGNLCNVHGRYGPCDAGATAKKPPKGGKGRKPKAPPKPKVTPEQRAQERAAQQAANRKTVLDGLGIAVDGQEALAALRRGEQPDPAAIARMGGVAAGLVEQAQDGSYRLTASGRAMLAAADAGDAGRAGDTISSARDRTSARTQRQEAAAQRKRDAEAKRAAAAAEAAKKRPAKGGGGGKGSSGSSSSSGSREAEHQADRARRQQEHEQDRAQRQREHEQDRAQRQRERSEDRQAQLEARRSRGTVGPAPARVEPYRARIDMPHSSNRGRWRTTHKAQEPSERAMFAKMGGGGSGGGGKGSSGGGSKLWKRDPDTGKRTPTAEQRESHQQEQIRRLAVSDTQRDVYARRAGDKAEHETRQRYRVESAGDGEYALRDYNRATSAYRGVSVASGSKEKVDRALQTKIRAARTRAENDAKQSVDFYNSDVRRGMYPNPSSAKRDREKFKSHDSFIVYKDATGAPRWLARTTTAYRDRDREILMLAALDADSQRMTAARQFGPLRWWHVGQPNPLDAAQPWGPGLDIGDCDYSAQIGTTRVESGTFRDPQLAQRIADTADQYELSPGFFHPPDQPGADGVYTTLKTFERSLVPTRYGRASNLYTGLTVKEQHMDEQEQARRFKAMVDTLGLTPDQAAQLAAGLVQTDKSAQAQGVAYKEQQPYTGDARAALSQPQPVYVAADGTSGMIVNGMFTPLMLKSADDQITTKAPMAPASMMQAGATEEADAAEEEGDEGDAQYVGDMAPAEFRDMLIDAFQEAIQSFGGTIGSKMAEMDDAVKAMGYARMKSEGEASARIAQLELELAALKGERPAVVEHEALAALKSTGPQAPPDANALPQPENAVQAAAMRTFPQLYQTNPNGQWAGWVPPSPS